MLNHTLLDELAAKFTELLNNSPAKDLEKNVKALLQQGFSKLDLVSREEFEVQQQLLLKAREQLDTLQARVNALEEAQQKQQPSA